VAVLGHKTCPDIPSSYLSDSLQSAILGNRISDKRGSRKLISATGASRKLGFRHSRVANYYSERVAASFLLRSRPQSAILLQTLLL
jgi:hypothetical protein